MPNKNTLPSQKEKQVYAQWVNNTQPEVNSAIETLFCQLPVVQQLTSQSRVVIKPNLLAKHPPEKAVTTHPFVVKGVILALQKRGVTNITVVDSPGGPASAAGLKSILKGSGIAAVCEETGVRALLGHESSQLASAGKLVREFTFLKAIAECDFLINLPKLKTHVLTGLSGAVKNLFGCIPGLQKAEFHMRFPQKEQFGQMLVDVCETARPALHIVDGILCMQGDGPSGGEAVLKNILLAGENPYTLDLALCRYIGLSPARVPTLAAAIQWGFIPPEFEEQLLVGSDEAKQPFTGFKPPRSYDGPLNFTDRIPAPLRKIVTKLASPRPVIHKKTCIGCGKCAEICPQKVITIQHKKAVISYKNCIRCFCCHEMCPVKAIDVKRLGLLKF